MCILQATAIALTVLLCKSIFAEITNWLETVGLTFRDKPGAEYGAGRHISEIPEGDVLQLIKVFHTFTPLGKGKGEK